jgi:hypothetical protein
MASIQAGKGDPTSETRAYAKDQLEVAQSLINDPGASARDLANREFHARVTPAQQADAKAARIDLTGRKAELETQIMGGLKDLEVKGNRMGGRRKPSAAQVEALREERWQKIAPLVEEYAQVNAELLTVPKPPYPEQDVLGASAMGMNEPHLIAMREASTDLAVGALTTVVPTALAVKGLKGAATVATAVGAGTQAVRSNYSHFDGLAGEAFTKAASDHGLDLTDADAVGAYLKDNPHIATDITQQGPHPRCLRTSLRRHGRMGR